MTQIELKCKYCGNNFYTPLKRYNYLKKKNNNKDFYCSKLCFFNDVSVKLVNKNCLFCNKKFNSTTARGSKKCCSLQCSAKYSGSFVDPIKMSIISKKVWKNKIRIHKIPKKRICNFCKNEFIQKGQEKCCNEKCRKNKMSVGGRISVNVQNENRRSRNEIHFSKLCNENFYNIRNNEPMFNGWDADVILMDQKIAVLWNGRWHYDKLKQKHSVKQVQNRDSIKVKEIIKAGYIPYIIKDLGKEDVTFVENEFKKFCDFLLTDYKK